MSFAGCSGHNYVVLQYWGCGNVKQVWPLIVLVLQLSDEFEGNCSVQCSAFPFLVSEWLRAFCQRCVMISSVDNLWWYANCLNLSRELWGRVDSNAKRGSRWGSRSLYWENKEVNSWKWWTEVNNKMALKKRLESKNKKGKIPKHKTWEKYHKNKLNW